MNLMDMVKLEIHNKMQLPLDYIKKEYKSNRPYNSVRVPPEDAAFEYDTMTNEKLDERIAKYGYEETNKWVGEMETKRGKYGRA